MRKSLYKSSNCSFIFQGDFSWGMGNGAGTWQTPRGDVITGNFRYSYTQVIIPAKIIFKAEPEKRHLKESILCQKWYRCVGFKTVLLKIERMMYK